MAILSKRARELQQFDVCESTKFALNHDEELMRCRDSVQYFFENHVQVQAFDGGIYPRQMLVSQARLFSSLQEHNSTIFLKDRAIGFSTGMMAYLLWDAMFNGRKHSIVVSPNRHMSDHTRRLIEDIYYMLPAWMKSGLSYQSKNRLMLVNGSSISFEEPRELFGQTDAELHVVFDEMAFAVRHDLERCWGSLMSCMSRGAKVTIASTNGEGRLFNDLWGNAWAARGWTESRCIFEPMLLFKE